MGGFAEASVSPQRVLAQAIQSSPPRRPTYRDGRHRDDDALLRADQAREAREGEVEPKVPHGGAARARTPGGGGGDRRARGADEAQEEAERARRDAGAAPRRRAPPQYTRGCRRGDGSRAGRRRQEGVDAADVPDDGAPAGARADPAGGGGDARAQLQDVARPVAREPAQRHQPLAVGQIQRRRARARLRAVLSRRPPARAPPTVASFAAQGTSTRTPFRARAPASRRSTRRTFTTRTPRASPSGRRASRSRTTSAWTAS